MTVLGNTNRGNTSLGNTNIHETGVVAPGDNLKGMRLAWGGVWSGLLVAVGVMLLLGVLGLAIGVTTADIGTGRGDDGAGLGAGAAIWSALTLLIALFCGGLAATRTSMVYGRAAGLFEGVLIWVLSMLALIYMAGSGIGFLSNSVFSTLGGVSRGAASAVGMADMTDLGNLASGDMAQITARLSDPKTAQVVAAATGVSQEEARTRLAAIAQRVNAAKDDPAGAAAAARDGLQQLATQAGQRVERAAARAQPYASTTLWITLAAMVLSLLAAITGALMGRRQVAERLAGSAAEHRVA